ncbi:MAG: CidA/LrgA family protein [Negativicutes bacterium]|nr:CidA/LrgA family protein [Negativicutes bacterium]
MLKYLRWSGQLALLGGVYWAGTQIAERSGLPIPGSVLGVILLFFLLLSGIVKLEYVEEVADFLLKHLTFFFVPIAVGLMTTADIFLANGWVLVVAILVGGAVPFWAVGIIAQALRRRRGECKI